MKYSFDKLIDEILNEASSKPKVSRNYWQEAKDAAILIKPFIAKWTQNTFDASKEELNNLKAATKAFKYEGPMYRYIEVWDKVELTKQQLFQRILKQAYAIASWARTEEGLDDFVFDRNESGDFDYDTDAPICHSIYCEQNGKGFDVARFCRWIKLNNMFEPGEITRFDQTGDAVIERAAEIQEIIAPYNWPTFKWTLAGIENFATGERSNDDEE